jgi:hypothetical protein
VGRSGRMEPPSEHNDARGRKTPPPTEHGHASRPSRPGPPPAWTRRHGDNTARQAGTALGVAVFGAVAGSPAHPDRFIAALRWLGVAAAIGWLMAAALIYSVAPKSRSGR